LHFSPPGTHGNAISLKGQKEQEPKKRKKEENSQQPTG